ncbi:MAG: hypothetical protein ABH870_04715, partial [bacterium]
ITLEKIEISPSPLHEIKQMTPYPLYALLLVVLWRSIEFNFALSNIQSSKKYLTIIQLLWYHYLLI